jgi:hypothetical protein
MIYAHTNSENRPEAEIRITEEAINVEAARRRQDRS